MIGIGVFVVMVIVVAGLAGGVGFMVGRGRAAVAEEQARHEKKVAEQMRQERDAADEHARRERDAAAEQAKVMQQQVREGAEARAALEAELAGEKRRFDEQVALLRTEQAEVHRVVEQMASQVMKQTMPEVLQRVAEQADQRDKAAARELDLRRVAIDDVVKPLTTKLEQVNGFMQSVEKDRVHMFASLGEQVQMMRATNEMVCASNELVRKETSMLVNALRQPITRGQWGERQLRTAVEAAGMLNQVDFLSQPSFTTDEEGVLRPDMVVKLGAGMSIVVDAKSPFKAFLDAQEARDDAARHQLLSAHAKHVRKHVDDLRRKEYWEQVEGSPQLVVMFVPSDVFLFAAQEQDPALWEYACRHNVVLATPTSLVMLLRTVAQLRQQEAARENIETMVKLCKEMTDRLRGAVERIAKLGKNLDSTVSAYNDAIGSLERRVLVTARRVDEMQVSEKTIPELAPIDRATRALAIPGVADDSVLVPDPVG